MPMSGIQRQDMALLYQMLSPESNGTLANGAAANVLAQRAAAKRKEQQKDIPAIPDPMDTTQQGMFDRAWGALPSLPASNAPSGNMDEYAPNRRPTSTASAVTALDQAWSPTQSQNTMDQGITSAFAAQDQSGGGQPTAKPPLDMSFINANFQQPQDGLSPGDVAAQQSGGMPMPKPRPQMASSGTTPAMGFDPAVIRASLGLPAVENAPSNATAPASPQTTQQATSAPEQYGPPQPTTQDLLYDMARGGGSQQQPASQTGNLQNLGLALMMGGLNTMSEASKPNANAMGSFGRGNTQGLQTLMTLNQLDERNQRYNKRDELGALSALANVENAKATRENTRAYQDAMMQERGADRDLRREMYQGSQDNQAAQLAATNAYHQALLGQRAQELAATNDYRNKSLELQSQKQTPEMQGVSPAMKNYQWIQERAKTDAEIMSKETDALGNVTVNPEKMRQNYDALLTKYTQEYGGGGQPQPVQSGAAPQSNPQNMPIPDWAPDGAVWKPDPQTGQPVLAVQENGKWMKVVPKSQQTS